MMMLSLHFKVKLVEIHKRIKYETILLFGSANPKINPG